MRLHTATVDTVSDSKGLGPHGLISTETITDSRRIGSRSPFMCVRKGGLKHVLCKLFREGPLSLELGR